MSTHEPNDLYEVLQLHPSAEVEVVQAAYRRLAAKYHPDHNDSPDALAKMKAINEAYETLSDPERRRAYDEERTAGRRQESADPSGPSGVPPRPSTPPRPRPTAEPAAPDDPAAPVTSGPAVPGWLVGVLILGGILLADSCNNAIADSLGLSRWLVMVLTLAALSAVWAVLVKLAELAGGGSSG